MKNQLKMLLLSTTLAVSLSAPALGAGMLDQPRTGQTRCYDAAGKEVTCTGSGQDGAIRAGAPIPTPRFQDNRNGTVTDKLTGLIWLKDANCAAVSSKVWTDALTAASNLANGTCGLSDGSKAKDWHLPNKNELLSLIDITNMNPALPSGHPFVNVQNTWYWTSTSSAYSPTDRAWLVHVGSGAADDYSGNYYKSNSSYVWPVRAGQ